AGNELTVVITADRINLEPIPIPVRSMSQKPRTLFEKIWDLHVVKQREGYPDVLYIDRHFIHEVTSPQAFAGLRKRGIKVFNPERTTATADHNVPTLNQHLPIREELSRHQVE